jgi:phosphoribosyl-dephospho-CoA transferase
MELKDIKNVMNKDLRLKTAFRAVKADMDLIDEKNNAFKRSAHDWIVFLNHENAELKQKMTELERKQAMLERALDNDKLSILRQV